MNNKVEYVYDWENLANFSCVTFFRPSDLAVWVFEISEWKNEAKELMEFLSAVQFSDGYFTGFNNEGYDYPVTHGFMKYAGHAGYQILYNLGQTIIKCDDRFEHTVWDNDKFIPQQDLMKIHHFDNKAKATSLKLLEFNMRMMDIQEIGVDPSKPITYEESRYILSYNAHDVKATFKFKNFSLEAIKFREELSEKYGVDFTNFNDTRIGAEIVAHELRKAGINVSKYNQTIRTSVVVSDIIFDYIQFENQEFNNVLDFFRRSRINPEKMKGFFKEKNSEEDETKFTHATINGFTFDFGAGGIHGSVKNKIFQSTGTRTVHDWDVEGYYPSLSITHRLYPAHLGETWCDVMEFLKIERGIVGKKTTLGGAYKLGGNGAYGKSNDKFSPFYDPQYTVSITINGQLLLCMLAEQLMKIPTLEMIQVNTDGLTFAVDDIYEEHCMKISEWWQKLTRLVLEHVKYDKMAVRDVNNYIAVTEKGNVKRIGAYAYVRAEEDSSTRELPWHKNHSAIVVKKAAEAAIVYGKDIRSFIKNHVNVDPFDFFLRAKVPRSALLVGSTTKEKFERPFTKDVHGIALQDGERRLANITRYYVSVEGEYFYKIMVPTAKQIDNWNNVPHLMHIKTGAKKVSGAKQSKTWVVIPKPSELPPMRQIGIESGFKLKECNTLNEELLKLPGVNIDYYVQEAEKLVSVFKEIK